jgi:WD40 repeat protein
MQIVHVYTYRVGGSSDIVSDAMITEDAELFGALVNGHPVLTDFKGNAAALPAEVRTDVYTASALSPDGNYLALATSDALKIVNLVSGEVIEASTDPIYQLVWQDSGDIVVAAHQTRQVSRWTVTAKRSTAIRLRAPRSQRNWRVALSRDDQHIYAASSFPCPNWICVTSQTSHLSRHKLPAAYFVHGLTPWREGVLGMLSDHTARFELIPYQSDLSPLPVDPIGLKQDVTALGACPDENWIVLGTVNGEFLVLSAEFELVARQILWHTPVRALAVCADGYVVTGSNDGLLKLVELFD